MRFNQVSISRTEAAFKRRLRVRAMTAFELWANGLRLVCAGTAENSTLRSVQAFCNGLAIDQIVACAEAEEWLGQST